MDQQSVTIDEETHERAYWAVREEDWEAVCPGLSEEDAALLAPVVVVGAVPVGAS
ncbi:hypothetical protein [Catenuloplanes atrovinosus]|uniref:Uncharacterized protein n=1 Tax=Catenuloplanes atrovinosus TaxID=137266 RepID=A0AAE4CD69_9ACTN|nr:hypothetical protein [Catenuloplanes atrovinosus]MDR7278744.1 hypothetical protein [Catenuloplanes atrovinosus]